MSQIRMKTQMTEETNHNAYKLGLALSGGGAKGFAHIGVFRLLEECGLKPDIIVGTSVGSLMGALFADGYTSDELKNSLPVVSSPNRPVANPEIGIVRQQAVPLFSRRHLRAKTFEELKLLWLSWRPILTMARAMSFVAVPS